jgi:hypothetical protein
MPGTGGIHQVDGDLGVLDPAGGTGVLTLHPGGGALLQVSRLVDDQHRGVLAQVLDHIVAHVVADPVVVPDCPGQQVLYPVGAGVAGVLGDRPAVLSRQVGEESKHERPGVPSWLDAAEPACDPAHQGVQFCLQSGRG